MLRDGSLRRRAERAPIDEVDLPEDSVAVVVGTRPEAIKMSQIVHRLGSAALLIHTGQHYSHDLWSAVTDDLGLPQPRVALTVGGESRSTQIGDAVSAIGALLARESSVRAVVVQGDTNATLAGAIAANSHGLPLFHVEAGLRSHDRRMPEEHNRVLVDHLSDLCFAPSRLARENLIAENIDRARIVLTGNTVVEVARRLLPGEAERREICIRYGVAPGRFVLATVHRPENTDDPQQLHAVLADLRAIDSAVILALHPRTRAMADPGWLDGLAVVDALPPRVFLSLLAESALVITDSGGVQEEVTVLGRSALTVRRSTERQEALGRWSELVQPGEQLRARAAERLRDVGHWRRVCSGPSPYGDGRASELIVQSICSGIDSSESSDSRLSA